MDFNGVGGDTAPSSLPGNVSIGQDLKVGGTVLLSDGTDSIPSLAFASERTTGFEKTASGETSYVTSGTKRVKLSSKGVEIDVAGSGTAPSLSFGTSGTGLYSTSSSTVTVSCQGTSASSFSNFGFTTQQFTCNSIANFLQAINGYNLTLASQPSAYFQNVATSSQTISISTPTLINIWNTTPIKGSGISCDGTNFVAPVTGLYHVDANLVIQANNIGYREYWFTVNNTGLKFGNIYSSATAYPGGVTDNVQVSSKVYLNASDTIQFGVYQNSASNLSIGSGVGTIYCIISQLY